MDENVKDTETKVEETENTDAETEEISSEDAGGSSDKGTAEKTAENSEKAEKTFTQAEVDRLIKERLARVEKKKTKTAEELGAEVATLNQTIAQLTQSNACYKAGIRAECVDDAVILAARLVKDDTDFDKALAQVVEKYPELLKKATPVKTGVKTEENEKDVSLKKLESAFGLRG
jgi:hypothetical protein